MPAALLLLTLLTPGLLLVRTALLLRGALTPSALLLRLVLRPLAPTTLLRLPLRRLPVGRLAGRGLTLRRPALLRRLLWALAPTATTLAGRLLSPATLLRRLTALSPLLPAWLAPRLPRTPRSLRRRRHIRSF